MLDDAELAGLADRDRNCRNRRNGVVAAVEIHHLADIHLVDMIAAEDGHMIGFEVFDQRHILINCVRGSAVPGPILGLHLRRDRDDEAAPHLGRGDIPSVDDVLHQTLRFELRQNKNTVDSAVDKVAQDKVDNTVFPSERNGRFCPLIGQGRESGSFSAGKNHSKNRCSHSSLSFCMQLV